MFLNLPVWKRSKSNYSDNSHFSLVSVVAFSWQCRDIVYLYLHLQPYFFVHFLSWAVLNSGMLHVMRCHIVAQLPWVLVCAHVLIFLCEWLFSRLVESRYIIHCLVHCFMLIVLFVLNVMNLLTIEILSKAIRWKCCFLATQEETRFHQGWYWIHTFGTLELQFHHLFKLSTITKVKYKNHFVQYLLFCWLDFTMKAITGHNLFLIGYLCVAFYHHKIMRESTKKIRTLRQHQI